MFKKITVLAMAVGVGAALALPASASAVWKDKGVPIGENVDLNLTGQAEFQGPLGGVRCQVTSTVTFFAKSTTGEVDTFVPHPGVVPDNASTERCTGTGGLAFCQIHDVTALATPWILHTAEVQTIGQSLNPPTQGLTPKHQGITVTSGNITSQATGGFCPIKKITLTGATVGIIPNQPNAITTVSLNGQLQAHLQTNNGTEDTQHVNVAGTLEFENTATESHTYDI